MDIIEFDKCLDTIKAFYSFLSDIIDKGYNNDINMLKLISKYINDYIDDNDNNDNDEESEKDEEEEESVEDKIQKKIDKFLKSENDLSKIYLYKKYNEQLIINMNKFIESSLIY